MIALGMIVSEILADRIREGAFTQHHHAIQGFLLDGAHEPFAVRVEVRTLWREEDGCHTAIFEQRIKCAPVYCQPEIFQ